LMPLLQSLQGAANEGKIVIKSSFTCPK